MSQPPVVLVHDDGSTTPLGRNAPPFRIRDARDADFGFILDTWRRSFEGSPAVNNADKTHLQTEMAITVGRAIKRQGAIVRVACDPEDDDVLIGWAAANERELHYVYVRGGEPDRNMRGMGIARALIEPLKIRTYTFRTQAGERRLKPRERGWSYTPRFTF